MRKEVSRSIARSLYHGGVYPMGLAFFLSVCPPTRPCMRLQPFSRSAILVPPDKHVCAVQHAVSILALDWFAVGLILSVSPTVLNYS
jgi:hypothetical protein